MAKRVKTTRAMIQSVNSSPAFESFLRVLKLCPEAFFAVRIKTSEEQLEDELGGARRRDRGDRARVREEA